MGRLLGIKTKLGEGTFEVRSLTCREAMSTLFEYRVELISEQPDIQPNDLLGSAATVSMEMPDGATLRHFNGYIARFGIQGEVTTTAFRSGRGYLYQAVLRPWLWFLTRTSTCQIFQNMDVLATFDAVFARHGSGLCQIEKRLTAAYPAREYCVQYRETDFKFFSRLCEREGLYYTFEHEADRHTLVLYNDKSKHVADPVYATLHFQTIVAGSSSDAETVMAWDASIEVQSGRYAVDDYNFLTPKVDLVRAHDIGRQHALSNFEMYDYHGDFSKPPEGDFYARMRIEELQCQHETAQAGGSLRGIQVGRAFELADHPAAALNREYLVVSHQLDVENNDTASSAGAGGGAQIRTRFSTIPKDTQFRAPRVTPDAVVQGPQTAVVVGPASEEIHTDEHGRVKVQFHWDRYGKKDENSSCWIRVSQPWAGTGWGGITIPRIGQEVIVDFIEGDPDRPVITGRVYNADNRPPYGLPGAGVISGMKSKTHKGQGNNELSMDDTAGAEKINLHAQYDMIGVVEHDETFTVHNNRSMTVDVDHTESVGNNQSRSIGNDQTLTVGNNQSNTIGVNQTTAVGSNRELTVGANETIDIGANQDVKVGANQTFDVAVNRTTTVGVADDLKCTTLKITADATVSIEAMTSISITCGASSITITPASVSISSPMIKLN